MKHCFKCKKYKEFSEFHKDSTKADRVQSSCKLCKINRVKSWQKDNPNKASLNSCNWQKRYPGKINAKNTKRRLSKIQRVPKWADLKAIKQFYNNCPNGYEVDHIYPLQGKTVSGLHVIQNLQYLPIKSNRSKGNKFPF